MDDPIVTIAGPSRVGVGGTATYTINAQGTGTGYNLTYAATLPPGVKYKGGTTSPAAAGAPTQVAGTGPDLGKTTLIWTNISDLVATQTSSLSFGVEAFEYPLALPPVELPTGSTFSLVGAAYVNSNPYLVPTFSETTPGNFTGSGSATSGVTTVNPLSVSIATGGSLLRGVHTHTQEYTLTVKNDSSPAASPPPPNTVTGATLTATIGGNLEFLGCGATDNTPGGAVEYPGAPRLTTVPAVAGCVLPVAVTTVGSSTQVTWDLGTLAAGETKVIKYRGGVPLLANTDTFTGGTPTAGSLAQGSNLSNNSGTSTAERNSVDLGVATSATVSGTWTGPVKPGTPTAMTDTASASQSIKDVSLSKSGTASTFDVNDYTQYTVTARTGEYRQVAGLVLTDVLPNGLCPISAATNFATGPGAADCAPVPGKNPTAMANGGPITAPPGGVDNTWFHTVAENTPGPGQFEMVFQPLPTIAANDTASITYTARMRSTYGNGVPPASADNFNNAAQGTGTSEQWDGPSPAGPSDTQSPTPVSDGSSVGITSESVTLNKQLAAPVGGGSCVGAAYGDASLTFREGDKACFRITIAFPSGIQTRAPSLTDFLPTNTTYQAGSADTTGSTVPNITQTVPGTNPPSVNWTMGDVDPSSGAKFAPAGATFVVTFAATIDAGAGSATTTTNLTGNLAKYSDQNTAGIPSSLRDQVDFKIAPPPQLTMTRRVETVNGSVPGAPANPTGIKAGDSLVFGVRVTNTGTPATDTDVPVQAVNVWEPLVQGLTCADIGAISDGGTCAAAGSLPGDPYPNQAVIVWALGSGDTIAPGGTRAPLTYTMTVPNALSTGTKLTGTAAVTSYETATNVGTGVVHQPLLNVDPTVPVVDLDSPDTRASSSFTAAVASLNTTQITSVDETNNNLPDQATIGETVTYTVNLSLPKGTVNTGSLVYTVPAGLDLASADGSTLPAGMTLTTAPGAGGTATLAIPSYLVATGTETVSFKVLAKVRDIGGNSQGTSLPAGDTFTSQIGPTIVTPNPAWASSTGVAAPTATSFDTPLTVVEPSLTLTKVASPTNPRAGATVTYTLTATNAALRPAAHDSSIVDCVPAGITFVAWSAPINGTGSAPVDGDGSNGCAVGTKKIVWTPLSGDLPAGSTTQAFTATVTADAAAGTSYINTAALTASSMSGVVAGERTYGPIPANAPVTTPSATITKAVSPAAAAIGDSVDYTITATIPANVNLYQAAIVDRLPAGRLVAANNPVVLLSSTCTSSPACSVSPTGLTNAASGADALIGWGLGDLSAVPYARTVTLVYRVKVADVAANLTAGSTVSSAARINWYAATGSPAPTSAGTVGPVSASSLSPSLRIKTPSLSVTNDAVETTIVPGQDVTFTVTATNGTGVNLSTAYGVDLRAKLPDGLVPDLSQISGGTYVAGPGPDGSGGTITWPDVGDAAPGASLSRTYVVKLASSSAVGSGVLTTTGTITGYESAAPGNGGHVYTSGPSMNDSVTPKFPLITATATTPSGNTLNGIGGEPLAWRDTLTNNSPTRAYTVGAVNTLPLGWTYQPGSAMVAIAGGAPTQVEPTLGTAPGGEVTLTWAPASLGNPSLLPTEAIVINFIGISPAGAVASDTTYTNTVQAGDVTDATGAIGSLAVASYSGAPATATATAITADIKVEGSAALNTFVPGSNGSYSFDVSNLSSNAAAGPVTLVVTVDPSLTAPVGTGSGWTCVTAGSTVTCTLDGNAPVPASGSVPTVTITAGVPAGTTGGTALPATAVVHAETHDPVPANNTVTVTGTVSPTPVPLTSTGVGTATQSVTVTPPTGGTVMLLAGSTAVTTLTSPGQGKYTVDPTTGAMTFTPELGFSGTATPADYQVTDSLGQTGSSTYTPTVDKPTGPSATPQTSTGVGIAPQSVTVTPPDGGTVMLLDGSTPVTTLTIPGQGQYTVDPTTGVITFTPEFGFSGTATPADYQVMDAYGQTADSTYTPTVDNPTGPSATPQTSTGVGIAPQSVTVTPPDGGTVML
ncbi:MAG: hypothetical protein WAU06_05215, partial [Candidatus Nanopelagicales bacterium]